MQDVYEIIHNNPELKTVEDFVKEVGSCASQYIDKESDFLNVLNKQGVSNRQSILSRFKQQNLREKYDKLPAKQIPIKVGTKLAIPYNKVDRVGLLTQGIQVVQNDVVAFKAKALAQLEKDEKYRPISKIKANNTGTNKGTIVDMFPQCTVWVWCRALSGDDLGRDNEGTIFNITPFIENLSTNVNKNVGNFQMTLPPIVCKLDENNQWSIVKDNINRYINNTEQYVSHNQLLKTNDEGNLIRSQFLFHNILSTNDLVFIRFETLQMEEQQRINDNKNFVVDKGEIAGRIYDMIGLIDTNSLNVSGQGEVNVTIVGRDLSKLFIEDGVYFYPLEMTQGQLHFAGGSTQKNALMQRVITNNSLQYFSLYFNNSIQSALQFIIQQLSNIKIIPDSLFESYGDRRNYKYDIDKQQKASYSQVTQQLEQLKKQGVQYIMDIRRQSELTLQSNSDELKKCDELWNNYIHFYQNIRGKRVRVVKDNKTVGWSNHAYVLPEGVNELVSQDAFPQHFNTDMHLVRLYCCNEQYKNGEQQLSDVVDEYLDVSSSINNDTLAIDKQLTNGIWQIIKLVVDESVTERRIVDSSMSSANGALLNFIRKLCQEPFVEFYMDTYGDTYNLIVRRPPTDRKSLLSILDGNIQVEGEDGEYQNYPSSVIDIEIEDVINENLSYDDADVYSWYHLTPQANFIGGASTYSLAYLPAIYFEEYADIWGSRPLQITHNYMCRLPLNYQSTDLDITERQAFVDMQYLIESHSYLPFTRKGSITLNGDRRLKIGNICRYKPTGEIFFIDHVQNSLSVSDGQYDRTTTIQVSRGMVEKYIRTQQFDNGKKYGYFDIINTELDLTTKDVAYEQQETVQVGTKRVYQRKSTDGNDGNDNSFADAIRQSVEGKTKWFAAAEKFNGYGYKVFNKQYKETDKVLDCSGFVTAVLKQLGKTAYGNSEELMINSNDFRQVDKFVYSDIKEGDVLGIDTGQHEFDKGRKLGIDHIVVVVFNMSTGKLQVAESTGSKGVVVRDLAWWIDNYNKKAKKKFIGNYRNTISNEQRSYEDEPVYKTITKKIIKKEFVREQVFSNFTVNKSCFNFFVRRRQNNN